MFKYISTLLLILILLTGCTNHSTETAIIIDAQRTDLPNMADIQKVRPGMSYESVNNLLGDPYKCISDDNIIEIGYKLEYDTEYTVFLKDSDDGIAYVNSTSLYCNPEAVENDLSPESSYIKWKLIWPEVDNACVVNLGMTVNQVETLRGLPQYSEGVGLMRDVYYLSSGYSANIYYSYSTDANESVVCRIDILPLTWGENSDYYLITIANIIIPILIAAAIILVLVICYRRYKIKRV